MEKIALLEMAKFRLFTFRLVTVLPVPAYIFMGSVLAGINSANFALLVLLSLGLKISANSLGEAFDYSIDKTTRPESQIVKGNVSSKSSILLGLSIFLVCLLVALTYFNLIVSSIVLTIISLSILYTNPYCGIKRKFAVLGPLSLSVLFCLLFLMPLFVKKSFLTNNELGWFAVLLLNTSIVMLLKDFKDYYGDKKFKIKTPVVLFGPENISAFVKYTTFIPLILALITVFSIKNSFSILVFITVFIFYIKYKSIRLLKNPIKNSKKLDILGMLDRMVFPFVFGFLMLYS